MNSQFVVVLTSGGIAMRRVILSVVVTSLVFLWGDLNETGYAADVLQVSRVPSPVDAKWDLIRDFKIDGKLEETENNMLQLKTQGNRLVGHFLDKKAAGKVNESIFSGEVATREKPLLILRQDGKFHKSFPGHELYVAIYTGHLVAANHYRGTWHDNAGGSGEFELKVSKQRKGVKQVNSQKVKTAPDPQPDGQYPGKNHEVRLKVDLPLSRADFERAVADRVLASSLVGRTVIIGDRVVTSNDFPSIILTREGVRHVHGPGFDVGIIREYGVITKDARGKLTIKLTHSEIIASQ